MLGCGIVVEPVKRRWTHEISTIKRDYGNIQANNIVKIVWYNYYDKSTQLYQSK